MGCHVSTHQMSPSPTTDCPDIGLRGDPRGHNRLAHAWTAVVGKWDKWSKMITDGFLPVICRQWPLHSFLSSCQWGVTWSGHHQSHPVESRHQGHTWVWYQGHERAEGASRPHPVFLPLFPGGDMGLKFRTPLTRSLPSAIWVCVWQCMLLLVFLGTTEDASDVVTKCSQLISKRNEILFEHLLCRTTWQNECQNRKKRPPPSPDKSTNVRPIPSLNLISSIHIHHFEKVEKADVSCTLLHPPPSPDQLRKFWFT